MSLLVVLLKPIFAKNDIDMLEDKPYIVNAYNKDAFSDYLKEKWFPIDGSISISDSAFDDFMRDYLWKYRTFPKLEFNIDTLSQSKTNDSWNKTLWDKLIASIDQPQFMKKYGNMGSFSFNNSGSSSSSGSSGGSGGSGSSGGGGGKGGSGGSGKGSLSNVGEGLGQAAITLAGEIGAHYLQDNYSAGKAGNIANVALPVAGGVVGGVVGGPWGAAIGSAAGKLIGAGVNRLAGIKPREKALRDVAMSKSLMDTNARRLASVSTSNALGNALENFEDLKSYKPKDLYKQGPLTSKGTRLGNAVLDDYNASYLRQLNAVNLGAKRVNKLQGDQGLVYSAALGGPLMLGNNIDPSTAIGYDFMNTYLTNRKGNDAAKGSTLNSPFAGVSSSVLGNTMAKGGKIEIKHPGRLTELKKRTGKTEAQLWAEGDPEVRKMINFARQARKWNKHAFGGYLEGQVYDISEEEAKRLIDAGYELEYM